MAEVPTREDIRAARERISPFVRRTPSVALARRPFDLDVDLRLKLELLQHTGSFKARGAFNKMLASDVPSVGVIAASGGNFGLAVAYAARALGHRAQIVIPRTSPEAKIDGIRRLRAEVTIVPGFYAEAADVSGALAAEIGALSLHPFDQPEVVAGQGTIGIELEEEHPDVDTVLVAIGGGGLIGGIASWFRGNARVIGVEAEACATMTAALEAGEPVVAEVGGVAADSLGAARVGDIAFDAVRAWVDRVVTVPDDAIVETQRLLWRELRLVVEPGGAAATAALLTGAYRPADGERVVSVVCGANCDPATVTSG